MNKTYKTYRGWLRAINAIDPQGPRIDGDKDIATAFCGPTCIGEWDGERGEVYPLRVLAVGVSATGA
jgi:hypothetical protein